MTTHFARRRFTVDEYHRLAEVGILTEDDRVELLYGEIVVMNPIGPLHAYVVARMNEVFHDMLADRCMVWPQNPLDLSEVNSEPQPDIVLLRRDASYRDRLPSAADVVLVVEVADTSLAKDRRLKLPLYATAGVPEVWIVDLAGNAIEVCSEPGRDSYRGRRRLARGERVCLAGFPDVAIEVGALLG